MHVPVTGALSKLSAAQGGDIVYKHGDRVGEGLVSIYGAGFENEQPVGGARPARHLSASLIAMANNGRPKSNGCQVRFTARRHRACGSFCGTRRHLTAICVCALGFGRIEVCIGRGGGARWRTRGSALDRLSLASETRTCAVSFQPCSHILMLIVMVMCLCVMNGLSFISPWMRHRGSIMILLSSAKVSRHAL